MCPRRAVLNGCALAILIAALVVQAPAAAQTQETPRRGGVLLAAIAADAPSLDPHQEQTFATMQMVAPLYSTLLQIDPYSYPKIIGDVATEWKIAPDGLTYNQDENYIKAHLDEDGDKYYKLEKDEIEFFSSQTGIKDPEELKKHMLNVQREAYDVCDSLNRRLRYCATITG